MATTALPTTTTTWGIAQMERHTAEISAALQKQIDEQRTPTTAAGVPWA
jgi:hypothetical protein